MNHTLLEARGLVKSYPGLRALDGVDFVLQPGEVHGLVGPNGAGKSTLIKILTGVVRPDAGSITLEGQVKRFASPLEAAQAGIAVVHQELSLVPGLSVAENLLLGQPYPLRNGLVDWASVRSKAREALAPLSLEISLEASVKSLSPAVQTLVAIARALAQDAKVLILDEPTASLTASETERLFEHLEKLRSSSVAIVYVSHRLNEIVRLSDRITVIRDGRVVALRERGAFDGPELVQLLMGGSLANAFPEKSVRPPQPAILEARSLAGRRVRNVSFKLEPGEVLGLAGLTGSGRSRLLRLLAGAERPTAGALLLAGREVRFASPGQAIQAGVALVPEERRTQALVADASVRENISLAHLNDLAAGGIWLRLEHESERIGQLISQLGIRTRHANQAVRQLSGGNQQKVVLARYLLKPPKILLLDEPTRGVDVATKREIYAIIRRLTLAGTAVLLVSSELDELLGLSDRVIVLRDGRSEEEFVEHITEERVSKAMFGELQPAVMA
jgi:ABC-type sugar transport system ATPase subunit